MPQGGLRHVKAADARVVMLQATSTPVEETHGYKRTRAWSPYVAGVIIGLLQIPTFLLMNTALGASSSFVTVGAHIAGVVDPAVAQIKYFATHMGGAKNWWQVAVVVGIAIGAFLSMRLSGATPPVDLAGLGAGNGHHVACRRARRSPSSPAS